MKEPRGTPPHDPSPGGSAADGFASDATGVGTLPEELMDPQAEAAIANSLWAVVFAGGIGSRFWPLSTPERPKQLLPLVDEKPLIADTVQRLHPLVPAERILVLTAQDIAPALRKAIPEVPLANVLAEPYPLGTAASLAWGAHEVAKRAGPKTVFVALHADLAAAFPEEFRFAVRRGAALAARERCPAVLGVRPTRPETAFGWMQPGVPLEDGVGVGQGGACDVARFVEKPDVVAAAELMGQGALWNSGIYLFEAQATLDAVEALVPEVADGMSALAQDDIPHFAERIEGISLEKGLLERSDRLLVVPAEFGWDDVGTWACLRRARDLDDDGNGAKGDVHFVDAENNVVHTESGSVVLYGLEKMLVVSLDGLTFVTTLDKAKDLRTLLDQLPGSLRYRPTRS
jgi:mannose-1-phosphate guanylyltransferase